MYNDSIEMDFNVGELCVVKDWLYLNYSSVLTENILMDMID